MRHKLSRLRDSQLTLDFQYQVIQLSRLDWRDFLQTQNPVAIGLMARMRIAPNERWRAKAASLRLLAGARLSGAQRRLLGQFIDRYLPLQAAEEQAFRAEVATFAAPEQETVMELLTSWERKGRAEGRIEGQRLLVERQLSRKLGPLPDLLRARLELLSLSQLSALGEALLDFMTPADLDSWLATPPLPQDDDSSPAGL